MCFEYECKQRRAPLPLSYRDARARPFDTIDLPQISIASPDASGEHHTFQFGVQVVTVHPITGLGCDKSTNEWFNGEYYDESLHGLFKIFDSPPEHVPGLWDPCVSLVRVLRTVEGNCLSCVWFGFWNEVFGGDGCNTTQEIHVRMQKFLDVLRGAEKASAETARVDRVCGV